MDALTPRQGEILDLLGIVRWRLRQDNLPVPGTLVVNPAESLTPEKSDSAMMGPEPLWRLMDDENPECHDTWVFCQASHQNLATGAAHKRLLQDIFLAMGLQRESVSLFIPATGDSARNYRMTASQMLQNPDQPLPKCVVSLGQDGHAWVRMHFIGDERQNPLADSAVDGKPIVLFFDDMDSLLAQPARKQVLWQQIVASGCHAAHMGLKK